MSSLPVCLGSVRALSAAFLAESAIATAEDYKGNKCQFIVRIDGSGMAWVDKRDSNPMPSELVCGFVKSSDPKWLEGEIQASIVGQ